MEKASQRSDPPVRVLEAEPSGPDDLPRAELLHVLMLPDLERAERIGKFWSYPQSRTFAKLVIDCEEDRTLRAVLIGMLQETDQGGDGGKARRLPIAVG